MFSLAGWMIGGYGEGGTNAPCLEQNCDFQKLAGPDRGGGLTS
jgi:hypothetical protein